MTLRLLAFGITAMVASATPVMAHHSFAAEFDVNKPVTLRGTLTKMEWVNPHGWIYMNVKGPDGKVVNWAIEAGATNQMLRRGLRQTDFQVGTELVVEGYQARNGSPTANGATVKMADGRNFFLGSPDTGAPGPR